jgi:hypothetical protein
VKLNAFNEVLSINYPIKHLSRNCWSTLYVVDLPASWGLFKEVGENAEGIFPASLRKIPENAS